MQCCPLWTNLSPCGTRLGRSSTRVRSGGSIFFSRRQKNVQRISRSDRRSTGDEIPEDPPEYSRIAACLRKRIRQPAVAKRHVDAHWHIQFTGDLQSRLHRKAVQQL